MPRLPPLGFGFKQRVFNWQRVRSINERVHAVRVSVQCRLGIFGANLVVSNRNPSEVASANEHILFNERVAQIFADPAEPAHPVVVHLPQPILCRRIALSEEQVVEVVGADVRYAPGISVNLCARPDRTVSHRTTHVR